MITPEVPELVQPAQCDHAADPPICMCVHDWRIEWGNRKKGEGG